MAQGIKGFCEVQGNYVRIWVGCEHYLNVVEDISKIHYC